MAGTLFAEVAASSATTARRPASAVPLPHKLLAQVDRDWSDQTTDLALIRLAARVGREAAQRRAESLASDAALPPADRVAAICVLGEVGQAECIPALLELVGGSAPAAVQLAACDALARFDDPRIASTLLEKLAALDAPLRTKVCDVLLGRRDWAGELLRRVEAGDIPPETLAVDQLRVVALFHDESLDALVKKHWGAIHGGTPEERLAEMRRINNDLAPAWATRRPAGSCSPNIAARVTGCLARGTWSVRS